MNWLLRWTQVSSRSPEFRPKLFDSGYEDNLSSLTRGSEKLADFGDLMIVDGSTAAPAGSGSVGELEAALTKGIQSLQMLAESNSTTVRFDQCAATSRWQQSLLQNRGPGRCSFRTDSDQDAV